MIKDIIVGRDDWQYPLYLTSFELNYAIFESRIKYGDGWAWGKGVKVK